MPLACIRSIPSWKKFFLLHLCAPKTQESRKTQYSRIADHFFHVCITSSEFFFLSLPFTPHSMCVHFFFDEEIHLSEDEKKRIFFVRFYMQRDSNNFGIKIKYLGGLIAIALDNKNINGIYRTRVWFDLYFIEPIINNGDSIPIHEY